MAAALQTVGVELQHPTYFSGRIKEKNTVAPREFIQDVVRRKEKNRWDDDHTMAYVAGSLIGKAAVWFNSYIPATLYDSPAEAAAFKSDFEVFKQRFCQEYGLADIDAVRTARSYADQRTPEDNFDFVDRVYAMGFSSYNKANEAEVPFNVANRLAAFTGVKKGEPMPFDGDELIALYMKDASGAATNGRMIGTGEFLSDTVRIVLVNGLRDKVLRSKCHKLLLENKGAKEIANFIKQETLAAHPEGDAEKSDTSKNGAKKNGNGSKRNGNGSVTAIEDDATENEGETTPNDDMPIDKVTAKPNGRRQKGKSTKKPTAQNKNKSANGRARPERATLVQCDYCKGPNHTAEKCVVKKYHDKHDLPTGKTFSVAVRKDREADPSHNLTQSGNDAGPC